MLIAPVSPPVPVAVYGKGGFDYVTVDSARRRVYAAHKGSNRLLIVDADTGKVRGQVIVGPMQGSAHDPVTGIVYTGNGDAQSVSEVDPVTRRVLRTVAVPGPVDAIAYDRATRRVYADEDSGTEVYVIDTRTMKLTARVRLPGHDEEYLAVDPRTHVVYQNVPDKREFVEIDPVSLRVKKIVPTPLLESDHPLQYDADLDRIVDGGKNGVMTVYTPGGRLVGHGSFPPGVDQCSLDQRTSLLACASKGVISVLRVRASGAPVLLARLDTHHDGLHTIAIDANTRFLWGVWTGPQGDFVQRFRLTQ
ncbi:MAG TPA: YncE family protein [Candidatus Limnocylindria bacterium]|nr:YncE family protein [Candidatus Limnocylindria bacterium]